MKWLLERLNEKTSWLGIFAALSAVGVKLGSGMIENLAALGVAVAAFLLFLLKEKK